MNPNKFKVVLMGASSAGKTSIVIRISNDTFGGDQESTIGAAFISRDITTEKGQVVLHIWDTAGQERYRSLVPKYSQGSKAVIIVFDVSDIESYDAAKSWVEEAIDQHAKRVKYYFVANKIDLEPAVDLEKVSQYAKENDLSYFQTSAKTGSGIRELFEAVANDVSAMFPMNSADPDGILIAEGKKSSKGCC